MFHRLPAVLPFLAVSLAPVALAQDWANWRGPNHDGSTSAKDLPVKFSTKKNVRWSTVMPGPAASTPIVVGERIFLSSTDSESEQLVALCVDRASGKITWRRDVTTPYTADVTGGARIAGGRRSNYASPSPATDGKRVVFFFGNGDLVAFDLEGEKLWARNIQEDYGAFAFQWTFSASPTIFDGRLFLPVLQRDVPVGRGRRGGGDGERRSGIESFVLAMDLETGKTIYKHVRPSPARVESLEAYTTLIPRVTKSGRKELLCVGGDVLTAHDPESGKELWRWGTWNEGHRQRAWRLVPTVVLGGDLALVCAPKRAPVYAVRLADDASGDLGEDALVWKSEGRPNEVSSDVPTPAYHNGAFYVLNDNRASLSKVAAKDGSIVWTTQLTPDFKWRASPTWADGKLWCIDHNGNVVVVDADTGKILHMAILGDEDDDQIRASVVAAHGALFIRTNDKLWCIAE